MATKKVEKSAVKKVARPKVLKARTSNKVSAPPAFKMTAEEIALAEERAFRQAVRDADITRIDEVWETTPELSQEDGVLQVAEELAPKVDTPAACEYPFDQDILESDLQKVLLEVSVPGVLDVLSDRSVGMALLNLVHSVSRMFKQQNSLALSEAFGLRDAQAKLSTVTEALAKLKGSAKGVRESSTKTTKSLKKISSEFLKAQKSVKTQLVPPVPGSVAPLDCSGRFLYKPRAGKTVPLEITRLLDSLNDHYRGAHTFIDKDAK